MFKRRVVLIQLERSLDEVVNFQFRKFVPRIEDTGTTFGSNLITIAD